jgi:hypothetical protein
MNVYRAVIVALLALAVVGGITLMLWPQQGCRMMSGGGLTLWDASDPACRHLANQGSRR